MAADLEYSDRPMTRSKEKRARIVDAAGHLFVRHGYGAVSMDAIAAEANVSKRTVYSHFEDKATLFIAVMDAHCVGIGGQRVLHDIESRASPGDLTIYVLDDIAADLPDQSPKAVLCAFLVRFLKILLREDTVRLFRVVQGEAERFPELARSWQDNGPKPLIRQLSTFLLEQAEANGWDISDPELASWLARFTIGFGQYSTMLLRNASRSSHCPTSMWSS